MAKKIFGLVKDGEKEERPTVQILVSGVIEAANDRALDLDLVKVSDSCPD